MGMKPSFMPRRENQGQMQTELPYSFKGTKEHLLKDSGETRKKFLILDEYCKAQPLPSQQTSFSPKYTDELQLPV